VELTTLAWLFTVDGGLRAGWRLALHVPIMGVGIVVGALPAVLAAVFVYEGQPPPVHGLVLVSVGLGISLWVATMISGLVLDVRWDGRLRRGRLRGAGVGPPVGRAVFEIALGLVFGAAALVPAVGIQALGGMEVATVDLDAQRILAFLGIATALVFAAAWEELLFRGYGFAWFGGSIARLLSWGARAAGLSDLAARRVGGLGFAVPMLLGSLFFGVVHLMNPGASWIAGVNTALAGLWFAVIVVRTRTLWVAIAAHWSWNVVHGLVLGLPVSGLSKENGFDLPILLDLDATGPDWLGGGSFGVEGSIGATVAVLLCIGLAALLPRRRADQGMTGLVEPSRVVSDDVIEDSVTEEVTDTVPWGNT
jgi:membrane protease YdiL (CAAX protease family)